jgi:hypothetical protein
VWPDGAGGLAAAAASVAATSFGAVEAEAAGGIVFEHALAVIKQAKMKSLSVIPIESLLQTPSVYTLCH